MPERMKTTTSDQLFKTAQTLFPGGVNSPVRAFGSVGGSPLFFKRGKGAFVWDEDENKFLDFCCSWGPLITGHAHPKIVEAITRTVADGSSFGAPTRLENELAELIKTNHRWVEKIRFVSSGTEATMSALRLARGYTGKNKVIKFEGCYHGHVDSLLVKAGSGLVTMGTSSSSGVPASFAAETIVLPLNDVTSLETAFNTFKNELAAVIIEPVPANNGLLLQNRTFLELLRSLCTSQGVLLIFDEVISGFRIGFEGASGHYNIKPDILAFGKIIGGGLPVGAYAASAEIMSLVAPEGPVYQAGTLSGNPVAMSAGIAQLELCLQPGFYAELERKTAMLVNGVMNHAISKNHAFKIFHLGSIFWTSFSNRNEVNDAGQVDASGMSRFALFHHALLERGVYLGPSGYEVGFVSSAHSDADILFAIKAMNESLDEAYSQ